jgi:hypothetical protein
MPNNDQTLEARLKELFTPIAYPAGQIISTAEYKSVEIHEMSAGKYVFKLDRIWKEVTTLGAATAAIDKYIQSTST